MPNDHVPKCHISNTEHLQGRELPHLPGQPLPLHHLSLGNKSILISNLNLPFALGHSKSPPPQKKDGNRQGSAGKSRRILAPRTVGSQGLWDPSKNWEMGEAKQLAAPSTERGREGFVCEEERSAKVPPAAKAGLFQTQTVRGSSETGAPAKNTQRRVKRTRRSPKGTAKSKLRGIVRQTM